jgi:hypothetical protein
MIARCAILLAALFSAGDVFSRSLDSISSCDNRFIIFHRDNYGITLKGKRKSSKIYLGHDLNGGSIDPVASMFVVYGLPKNINLDSPQVMPVSIFKNFNRPRIVKKINLGGGIYAASFSKNHRLIVINTRFGDVIFDIKKEKITALPLGEFAKIPLIECKD